MTDANPENEPSMEEILASIRRIISDGEEGETEGEAPAPLAAVAVEEPVAEAPKEVFSALPSGEPEPEDDILDLTQMVNEQGEVVDLNEAKSARGLAPPVAEAASAAEPQPEAEGELTMEGLARALDEVIGEPADDDITPASQSGATRFEEVVPETAEEALEVPKELDEPLSPLDALAEIEALANQQAEMEAEVPLEPETPQAVENVAGPLETPAAKAPLELLDQFGAEAPQDSTDDALSEIDQILARAREAAQAQAAKALEAVPEAPSLSPEDETAALLAGLEPREETLRSPGQAIPEDIRTAVQESLGGGAQENDARMSGRDPFRAIVQADPNMAGAQVQASSGGEEQNLADRKDNSHPDFRSRGDEPDSSLISSNTAAGAIAALGDLSRAARQNSGGQGAGATALGMNRTLEELVLDAMTPHLKDWLDSNLEPLVERVVREEIQRLRRRSEDY